MNEKSYKCPVCSCTFGKLEKHHLCEVCHTPHHKDCWEYNNGCAVFGCRKTTLPLPIREEGTGVSTASVTAGSLDLPGNAGNSHVHPSPGTANCLLMSFWGKTLALQHMLFLSLSSGFALTLVFLVLKIHLPECTILFKLCFFLTTFIGTFYVMMAVPAALMRLYFSTIGHQTPRIDSSLVTVYESQMELPPMIKRFETMLCPQLRRIKVAAAVLLPLWMGYIVYGNCFTGFTMKILTILTGTFSGVHLFEKASSSRRRLRNSFRNKIVSTFGCRHLSPSTDSKRKEDQYLKWKKL